jgi:hypothetical protein
LNTIKKKEQVKKQKTPAENFSFKAGGLARAMEPEKFVRPDLSVTKIVRWPS